MTEFSFSLDEQIFLRNDTDNKVYTLTINRHEKTKSYDVTREWTIPNSNQLASKTDRFPLFKQAADLFESLYQERIKHGYTEVVRRAGIKKTATKIDTHKIFETKRDFVPNAPKPDQIAQSATPAPGRNIASDFQSRHVTGIHDRIEAFKKLPK